MLMREHRNADVWSQREVQTVAPLRLNSLVATMIKFVEHRHTTPITWPGAVLQG